MDSAHEHFRVAVVRQRDLDGPAARATRSGPNLDRTAARVGDHEALVECATGRRWTYPAAGRRRRRRARSAWTPSACGKGDRVGIWAPNCAEWVFVQYGTAKLGAILVNINPAYRTHELSYVLKQAGISVLVSRAGVQDQRLPRDGRRGARRLPRPARGRCSSATPSGSGCWRPAGPPTGSCWSRREAELSADDPINIQYTSGTTGFPKGATLTHHNLLNNGFFVGEGCGYTEADRICIPVPYYHCFGMGMGNLGGHLARRDDGHPGARASTRRSR